MSNSNKALTLIEILMVVVIVGILVGLALPNLTKMRERTFDREAQVNLKLIQAAQRIYSMERVHYFPAQGEDPQGVDAINQKLKLHLRDANWRYSAEYDAGNIYKADAERDITGDWARTWSINKNLLEPACTGTKCP